MTRPGHTLDQAGLFDLGPPTSSGRGDAAQRAYADSLTAQAFTAWADALAGYSLADITLDTPGALDEQHVRSRDPERVCVWCGAYVQKVYVFPASAWLAADADVRGWRGCGDEAAAGYELAEMLLAWARGECIPIPAVYDQRSDRMVHVAFTPPELTRATYGTQPGQQNNPDPDR